jgi:hypothetical protein
MRQALKLIVAAQWTFQLLSLGCARSAPTGQGSTMLARECGPLDVVSKHVIH